ncbi:hypothetical protein EDD22DRAFT_852184 [Suillus occidentalis]|nr:hypothetical protein EDD22DRAFT_852184 [Suillus occidentalis]
MIPVGGRTLMQKFFYSYWIVAAGVMVVYDWALTVGQEIELIWPKIGVVLIAHLTISANVLVNMPLVSLTDALQYSGLRNELDICGHDCHAGRSQVYGSRTQLIGQTPEETILSGIHICGGYFEGDVLLLVSMVWMLNTVWEVLALCLSVWIAVKHFCDLRRLGPSTGSTIGDCFRVLMKSHVLYFASLSPAFLNSTSTATMIFTGTHVVLEVVQMFVLGPRLILSIREYHAKLVTGSDADTSMNSIVFQEHVHISTSANLPAPGSNLNIQAALRACDYELSVGFVPLEDLLEPIILLGQQPDAQ